MKVKPVEQTIVVNKERIHHIKDSKRDVEEFIKETVAYKIQLKNVVEELKLYDRRGNVRRNTGVNGSA